MKTPIQFDEYYLIERVAVGGMAEVFKGITYSDDNFERQMAVKRVLPHIAEDKEFIDMFIDEAKLVSQLQHPNIPQIYHLGKFEQLYFISMEFISGQDLRTLFDRARAQGIQLDLGFCAHVVMEICEALDYAHRKTNARLEPLNLIHRDISPQNIIVAYDGTVKLVDFGIAKATGQINQTQAGILKGKFSYMSPEQARGYPIDSRSDLFGLGAVLYEIITLERCFLGQSDFSTIERVRNTEYRAPRQIRRDIPVSLERIMRKALAKSPEQRFQSAADFQEALSHFVRRHQQQYSRDQVRSFMASIFSQEINDENQRLENFRRYAAEYIPEVSQRHDSRRFRRATAEELSQGLSRPRFALGKEMKLSLEQDNTESLEAISLETHRDSVRQRRPTASRKPRSYAGLSRIALFILIALFTGSAAVALSWLNRPLLSTLWLDDIQGWRSQFKLTCGDKVYQGAAPVVIDQLPPGLHELQVTLPGDEPFSHPIELSSGQVLRLDLSTLKQTERGVVYLSSRPLGAYVFVNRQRVGKTPLELVLPNKQVGIKVTAAGYQDGALRVKPRSDLTITRHVDLAPLKIKWSLRSGAPRARFEIKEGSSQKSWRVLGVGDQEVTLSNRITHRVRVTASGYIPQEIELKPALRDTAERVILLKSLKPYPPEAYLSSTAGEGQTSTSPSTPTRTLKRRATLKPKKPTRRQKQPRSAKGRKRNVQSVIKTRRKPKRALTPKSQAQPGFLKLIAIPPARVFIDGTFISWTPLLNHKLSEGVHKITLRFASGEEKVISQSISAGRVSLRRIRK